MIKALMIITMVSGAEYTAKLPDMETCMKEIVPVTSQNDVKSAACIPRNDNSMGQKKIREFFSLFSDLMAEKRTNNYQSNCEPFPWRGSNEHFPWWDQ